MEGGGFVTQQRGHHDHSSVVIMITAGLRSCFLLRQHFIHVYVHVCERGTYLYMYMYEREGSDLLCVCLLYVYVIYVYASVSERDVDIYKLHTPGDHWFVDIHGYSL